MKRVEIDPPKTRRESGLDDDQCKEVSLPLIGVVKSKRLTNGKKKQKLHKRVTRKRASVVARSLHSMHNSTNQNHHSTTQDDEVMSSHHSTMSSHGERLSRRNSQSLMASAVNISCYHPAISESDKHKKALNL